MLLASNGVIPPKYYYHNSTLFYQKIYNNTKIIKNGTVAILLAQNNILPPR